LSRKQKTAARQARYREGLPAGLPESIKREAQGMKHTFREINESLNALSCKPDHPDWPYVIVLTDAINELQGFRQQAERELDNEENKS
jgi:hypothetical protein